MKKAIIYLRVSTSAQADKDVDPEGYSIPAQRDACRKKAEALDAAVIDEYLDRGESAKSAHRPALQAMLERVKAARDIDYVIVHKVDRLARSREDDIGINLALRRAGAILVSATENIDETPSGKLLHGIMATIAEFYSSNLASEALKGMDQKARTGGTPTNAPIGYLNVRQRVDGREIRTIALDPERAPLIRYAFERYATGRVTLVQLLDDLTARGLRTRETPKRPSKPLQRSRLHALLTNPYYKGIVRHRGMEFEGRHEPLVSAQLFEQVQVVLRAHAHGEKQRTHHHYLKGSVYCARCHGRLSVMEAKGTYLYFFCITRHRLGTCDQRFMPAEKVEDAVSRLYATIVLEPDRVDRLRNTLLAQLAKNRTRGEREARRQTARLERLAAERTKLLHAHYADAVPLDLLKTEQARIGREIADAEVQLEAATAEYEKIETALHQALDLAGHCERAYRQGTPSCVDISIRRSSRKSSSMPTRTLS